MTMDLPRLEPAALAFVEYETGDLVGMILAYISLLPLFLLFSLGVLIIVRRDLQTMMFLLGLLLNEVLNYWLKHHIREPRPARASSVLVKHGMPSSHAQLMGFFTIYMIFVVWKRLKPAARQDSPPWLARSGQVIATIGLLIQLALVAISRVYLFYHTAEQLGELAHLSYALD
ncbi:uncharacterized protein MONBRDRAFT_22862 [Monosiga brevicollis MX1]|uniref:Dolichyldiphosphatase n=1 Tax=Monosiga brevicollis TaxID=81824 RepID=A9USA5_MONBE|nr:uncharacterized protein MONBRDRAFT_22862 [Monosiga brevicollis MX1]EDQ91748.1 predicted protein [Monosiga brevicollis MX1]|eukprot:XP_001743034.1 hypothetical protein [Monosiga brevicollis MX1]